MISPLRLLPVLAAAAFVALTPTVSASTFNLQGSIGGTSTAFPNSSYGFLLADTAGDGFQFLTDTSLLSGVRNASANSFIGADDLIFSLDLQLFDAGAGQNAFEIPLQSFDTTAIAANWDAGDPFALVWFQSGTSNTNDPFGFYRTDTQYSNNGSNIAFITPGNESAILNDLATGTPGISNPSTSANASSASNGNIAAIPEPGTVALVGLALISLRILYSARTRRS